MNITFLTASLGSGGAERVVSLLANRMAAMGHQVEIICLLYDDIYYKTVSEVKLTVVPRECPGNLAKRLWWLRGYVMRSETDVCIAFTEGVYCATICSLLGTKIPVIASERLDPSAMSWQRNLLKKIFLPRADWLVVQTEHIKRFFKGNMARKTSIILNPVNDQVFHITPCEKENTIISVARLFPQKSQHVLIEAFAQVSNRFPDWKLVIYGEGPRRKSLQLIIERLQLTGRVLLPGRTEKVIDKLNQAKIFALSSEYEGLSNAMLEAVCVGLPIVSTRVSGTDELVQDGVNGYVVDTGNVKAIAQALERLMENGQMIEQFGNESKRLAEQFRLDTIVHEWLRLIKQVVKNNG